MKKFKTMLLSAIIVPIALCSYGQANVDPYIYVLPANSGIVALGGTLDLTITVGASGAGTVAAAKLRPIISLPPTYVAFLPDAQQTGIPVGWTIVSNNGDQLRICNNSDPVVGGTSRTVTLKVKGIALTTPLSFSGQMNFGNGNATTCANGPQPPANQGTNDLSNSTISVINLVPLTLTAFNAVVTNCEPTLQWTTTSETNTDRFEIEKSNINGTDWKKVGNVAATGYSNNIINYNFTDKDIFTSEKVLYRLKMIDQDGRFTYSKILPVLVNCKTASVLVYPNPVQDGKLFVTLAGAVGYTEASLISISGQLIAKQKVNNGSNNINVSSLANGVYFLQIKDANGFDKKTKVYIGGK